MLMAAFANKALLPSAGPLSLAIFPLDRIFFSGCVFTPTPLLSLPGQMEPNAFLPIPVFSLRPAECR
jgi:hypothetical protein